MTTRFLLVLLPLFPALAARAADSPAPKLAVVIVVDQLRADYLVRFRPYFGEGGFKRLLEGGADFRNAHYRHAITHTAPGHALMLSGVHSNVHGIIGNEWLDRDTWEVINSVEDRGSPLVGINPAELGPAQAKAPEKTGRSPKNFQAATVGDQLKRLHGEKSKVFAASNKDRSAILLGGQLGDAAYWDENGKFVTSRHYRAELPAWVAAFNAEKRAEAAFGKVWERLLPTEVYEKVQGPDDAVGELVNYNGLTRVFPKLIDGGKPTITPAFFSAYDLSPFTTEALGEFVRRAIDEEKLGRHAATDLLGVSFSQIDAVGHGYGPDSQEVMDAMLRLDRVLAGILAKIDREVGLAHCVIVLTADHGVARLPERMGAELAGRFKTGDLDPLVKTALDAKFGALPAGQTWMTRDILTYHLRPAALQAKGIAASEAAAVIKSALLGVPTIGHAFTRDELLAEPEGNEVLAMARRSYNASRGSDVMFFPKKNFPPVGATGSTHATPYDYDTHVPIVFFGQGVPQGVHHERVGIDDIAPTFAPLVGVAPPPLAKGKKSL